jgi:hypothetical protein
MKIDMGSNALNEAGWLMLDKLRQLDGEVSPMVFNNLKPALKEAIELFLTLKLEEKSDDH